MTHNISKILDTLGNREDLSADMAETAFSMLMDGELTPGQAGALLMGLRGKGETPVEVGAAVKAALARAKMVPGLEGKYLDSVGTGGDNKCSFNCSTSVALYLAGMGYQVVKHGNRAVSSSCGAADAVEALGLPMPKEPGDVVSQLKARNFVFLFAPNFHPAFKHIMPVRKDLGMRTLFNILGPLLNPARPTHMLLGVARPEILQLVAEVLLMNGVQRAAVFHGAGGYDELTPFGPARVVWLADGKMAETELDPAELGIRASSPEDVAVKNKDHALDTIKELLGGKGPEAMREMLVFNLAVAVHLLEDGLAMQRSVEMARDAVAQGLGLKVLD